MAQASTECSRFLQKCCVCSVLSDSATPQTAWPARLLCPGRLPRNNTGVGCHSLLQRVFPTQGLKKLCLLTLSALAGGLPLTPSGKPLRSHFHFYSTAAHKKYVDLYARGDQAVFLQSMCWISPVLSDEWIHFTFTRGADIINRVLSFIFFSIFFFPPALQTQWNSCSSWEKLKVGREGDDRGWDGWMASTTQHTWVWANSKRWWRAGKPGVCCSPWGRKESDTTQRWNHDKEKVNFIFFGQLLSLIFLVVSGQLILFSEIFTTPFPCGSGEGHAQLRSQGHCFSCFSIFFFGSQIPLSSSDKFGSTFQSVLIILSDFSQVSERCLSASRPGNVLCWEYPRRNVEYSWVFPWNPAHGLRWRLSMLTGKEY